MKFNINVKKEVEARFVKISAGVRGWDDFIVNGQQQEEEEGDNVFGANGDRWDIIIDADTGIVVGWPAGETMDVHLKCCDDFTMQILGEDKEPIINDYEDYVPNDIVPGEYGDYIIMCIGNDGKIDEWDPDFQGFYDNIEEEK